jgi:tetratricopeptide (TPR) repeat protein
MYLSDLALGYFLNGLEFIDRQLEMTEEDITRNALQYYMKAYGVGEEKVTDVISRIEKDHGSLTMPDTTKVEEESTTLGKSGNGDYDELLKALVDEPNNPLTLLSLGQICLENGCMNAGMEYFGKAVDLDPENAPFFFNDLSNSIFSAAVQSDPGVRGRAFL